MPHRLAICQQHFWHFSVLDETPQIWSSFENHSILVYHSTAAAYLSLFDYLHKVMPLYVTHCYNKCKRWSDGWAKKYSKKRKLNQLKVAMDLNISREALSYYENGKREPSLALLVEMSKYFNVSINYLITGEEFQKKWTYPFSKKRIGSFFRSVMATDHPFPIMYSPML